MAPMPHTLSPESYLRLAGVHTDLARVVHGAIALSAVDFRVQEGRRSAARQRQLVASGASQTQQSRHLTGHAVDLVALRDGRADLADWTLYHQIARAMGVAAADLSVPLRWGGCWCMDFADDPAAAVAAYVAGRRRLGKRPFLDGMHFELPSKFYPA